MNRRNVLQASIASALLTFPLSKWLLAKPTEQELISYIIFGDTIHLRYHARIEQHLIETIDVDLYQKNMEHVSDAIIDFSSGSTKTTSRLYPVGYTVDEGDVYVNPKYIKSIKKEGNLFTANVDYQNGRAFNIKINLSENA